MKTKIVTRTLALMITCLTIMQGYAQQTQPLVIGTYNIRNDNKGDVKEGNGWQERLPVITSIIEYVDYDIFGAQEVLASQLNEMQSKLPEYVHVGVGRDDGKEKGEFSPIFYKKDRFKELASGTFWMSETPDKPSKGWDAQLPRVCSWVHLQDKKSKKKVWFFNLHMDHIGVKAREESGKLVLKKMKELAKDEAVILTGDFNFDQNSPNYELIRNSNYVADSYDLTPKKMVWNGTFNSFKGNSWTDSRIDHVFVNKAIKVKHLAVLTESYRAEVKDSEDNGKKKYESKMPSDHFPVVVRALF